MTMRTTENMLRPVLVGFALPEELLLEVIRLNGDLDRSRIDFEQQIPHVTLWMGFVKERQVTPLNLGLHKVFHEVSVQTQVKDLNKFENQFGSVWSIDIQMNRSFHLLQNRVHHFFEPFREHAIDMHGFDQTTVDYINRFESKSLDNYIKKETALY